MSTEPDPPGASITPWKREAVPPKDVTDAFDDLIVALRRLQNAATAARPPVEVSRRAAALIGEAAGLLDAYAVPESHQLAGRLLDKVGYGNALIPVTTYDEEGEVTRGHVTFTRFNLGGGNAAHGGTHPLVFDQILGRMLAHTLHGQRFRTAYLHVDYRSVTPLDKPLRFTAQTDRVEGRKMFASGQLFDGDRLLVDVTALFLTLKEGQP